MILKTPLTTRRPLRGLCLSLKKLGLQAGAVEPGCVLGAPGPPPSPVLRPAVRLRAAPWAPMLGDEPKAGWEQTPRMCLISSPDPGVPDPKSALSFSGFAKRDTLNIC